VVGGGGGGGGGESVGLLQLLVVVDLAVVHDAVPALAHQRLLPVLGVHDRQPHVREPAEPRAVGRLVVAVTVWSSGTLAQHELHQLRFERGAVLPARTAPAHVRLEVGMALAFGVEEGQNPAHRASTPLSRG